jgi:hypothetical protein
MKRKTVVVRISTLMFSATLLGQSVLAQLTLTGTSYVQDFNSIGSGLPEGWTVRTNATAGSLGTVTGIYSAATKSWGDSTGEFGNCASTVNSGTNFLGTETSGIQNGCANRALSIRQTGTFGDPYAAFVLQITNAAGLSNFAFAVDCDLLRSNGYSTTWTIQYAVGSTPVFTTLGIFPDPANFFSSTRQNYTLGPDASNQSNLWIRFVALSPATGSGSRDTFGIDNFSLSWTTNGMSAKPVITGIMVGNGQVQVDFAAGSSDGPEVFFLQTALDACGPFSDAGAGAKIVQRNPGSFRATNSVTASQQFYRIRRP